VSRGVTLSHLVADINTERQHGNLSSAIRLFVLDYYKKGTTLLDRSFMEADQHRAAH
jgi:predicted DNA-binding ribbon-helix-helix protein